MYHFIPVPHTGLSNSITLLYCVLVCRAVNNGLLDTYQLKSLDGVLEAGLDEVKLVKQGSKFVVQFKDEDEDSMFPLDNFALREPYDRIVRCLGFSFDTSIFNK